MTLMENQALLPIANYPIGDSDSKTAAVRLAGTTPIVISRG